VRREACTVTQHRVWQLPAEVDTDQLAPGHAMKHGIEVIARHCLERVRPEFAGGVQPGDVLVAGPGFGVGSSREQAASVLRHLGVAAVIAPSYSGLFFRNAFNVGLLLLTCTDPPRLAEQARDGATLRFDARAGWLQVLSAITGEPMDGPPLPLAPIPAFLLDMVDAGGLLPQLKRRFQETPS
jgi:3-isopropylmalate/(R)-2-methylmalate dehydratase small subunit